MSDREERYLERAAQAGDLDAAQKLAAIRGRRGEGEQHGPWQQHGSGRTTAVLERAKRLGGAIVLVPNYTVGRAVKRLAEDMGVGCFVALRAPRGSGFQPWGLPILADHTWWEQGRHETDTWGATGVLKAARFDTATTSTTPPEELPRDGFHFWEKARTPRGVPLGVSFCPKCGSRRAEVGATPGPRCSEAKLR